MARTRLIAITALAVALAALPQQAARSQTLANVGHTPGAPAATRDITCVVYPLSGIGHDATIAQWLAETIPSVVEPESWRTEGVTIKFFAPSRVLVVRQTSAVHTKIKTFLGEFKSAVREEKGALNLRKPPVMQAEYTEPAPQKAPQTAGAGYTVPPPQSQPKHLFHLVLRYEGDGLPETAVAGLVKELSDAGEVKGEGKPKSEPKSEPAKGPSLGQLLHFIVRYEGDGIVDANVVALMKELYGANKDAGRNVACPSVSSAQSYPACLFGTSPTQASTCPQASSFGAPSSPSPPATNPAPSTNPSDWRR